MPAAPTLLRLGRWLLLLGLGGCIESYLPAVVEAPGTLLVVDGFINGGGRTRIKLSRTLNVGSTDAPPAVRGATVYILDNTGQRYTLRETSVFGAYISDSLQLPPARRYRLRIALGPAANAPTYESALVPLKVTPDFDRLEFVRQDGQLRLLASAHDASGQTRYYRWQYIETWEFNSAFPSDIEFCDGIIKPRTTPISTCWRTERPSLIRQQSTASLSQDLVRDWPVTSFSDRAERVKIRYSVFVTQAAETAEEFAYNEVLRKNTEAVGTVNDPLPSQLTGNVRRVGNEAEPVLGFVSAHTVTQRRLWLTPASLALPANWQYDSPYADCEEIIELAPDPQDRYPIYPPYTRVFISKYRVPTHYLYREKDHTVIGYYGSTLYCVDCRERGSTTKPSFW